VNYAGICALVAVAAISIAVVIAVAGLIWRDRQLGEFGLDAINVAVGGLLTLIGTYIGGRHE
jgi:hypothetical protein